MASTDQDIIGVGARGLIVNQQRARHLVQIMCVELRSCQKHGAVQRGAGAFLRFCYDSVLRFCSRLLIGCVAIYNFVKDEASPRARGQGCDFVSLATSLSLHTSLTGETVCSRQVAAVLTVLRLCTSEAEPATAEPEVTILFALLIGSACTVINKSGALDALALPQTAFTSQILEDISNLACDVGAELRIMHMSRFPPRLWLMQLCHSFQPCALSWRISRREPRLTS